MQWVEKYRPDNLNEITSQNNIINSLKNGIITKNIPHLIFYGGSGSGKTSTILALAKELFGKNYKDRIIELNASDERGINIVREKIKMYAKQTIKYDESSPPWKIIILDEADTMTADSQFALRRIIEEYSKVTRFCFICNYHNKIIDPIISRCSLFYFKPINYHDIYNKLVDIKNKENFNCSDELIHKIINISKGDLRKSINYLQKCYNSYDKNFNNFLLNEVSGIISSDFFNEIIFNIYNKNLKEVDILINSFYLEGYSFINQINLFYEFILNGNFNNNQKSKIILKLIDIDQNLIKGCDEYIQFIKFIYYIISLL